MESKSWADKLQIGSLALDNRVIMAALTRQRCDPHLNIPNDMAVTYYSQRAGAGFILTQATAWSIRGQGFWGAASLYNEGQAKGWKRVTQAVHAKNGIIFIQLFHCGRVSHSSKTKELQLWAPSALAVRQKMRDEGKQYPVPKQMTIQDIKQAQNQFEKSVILAKQAGFDGIQLHGAHGYLIDQFLRSASNLRTDQYGGSPQNRIRFCLELFDIALKHFSPEKIGIKISPVSRLKDMYDENPLETYSLLLEQLSKRNIGFVQIRESTEFYPFPNQYPKSQKQQMEDVCKALRPYFKGVIIGNDSFDQKSGLAKINSGSCDAISFGRYYISNPDLAERIINGWPLQKWDSKTFYGVQFGEKGYIDYPFYQLKQVEK